ncbi:NAD-dependent epimerase/dehydratase family protein [Solidesulfovibrio carbinoliphilus subsp. oakridgensis]|uniref:NAD-dependent epimerase/dehydratase family protein n=1 Tax=Solidesulfovibrio carbinoliphilus subsp. oakridgensis TaxID=694327 RepID=G7Q7N5_9BACT|nr:SDR family oxidoreductase [Solidesulfovibrio carbinoliphilus]EHJ47344.1 NAD-dependent epimerase/dehydratase family protein [Solidesulfovibrio carbinoliphilus subsp. oakridgensis]
MPDSPVLVTGATGYVGSRLVPRLLAAGYRVRAVGRSLDKLAARPFAAHPRVELAEADMRDLPAMRRAAAGCGPAYYLVHSMHPGNRDFAAEDREAAMVMARAADDAGISRIIYLGGLGLDSDNLSPHLRSRHEVGKILGYGRVPVTHLRAAMILGSGSASFEIMRYLVDRLPAMVAPRWVRNRCQPIAVTDVLGYLADCLAEPRTVGQTFDIGGPDVLTYAEIFALYARVAGLPRRIIIPVPLLSPRLSTYWMQLITPLPRSLIVPLVEGLRNEVVCRDSRILDILPRERLTCREAIARALGKIRQNAVESTCADAGYVAPAEWTACGDAPYAGGAAYECAYRAVVRARPEAVWRAIAAIGGDTGWYYGNVLWRIRGFCDQLVGGVGLRRVTIRREALRVGDPLDFWRVLAIKENRRLVLLAEMRTPGAALLEFRLAPAGAEATEITIQSRFLPRGLAGLVYWYALLVPHHLLFAGMLRGVARAVGAAFASPPRRLAPQPASGTRGAA